jgi:hypothetical protein
MTKERALAIFEYWFEHNGHWMWGTSQQAKDNATAAWIQHGIDGLPKWQW